MLIVQINCLDELNNWLCTIGEIDMVPVIHMSSVLTGHHVCGWDHTVPWTIVEERTDSYGSHDIIL